MSTDQKKMAQNLADELTKKLLEAELNEALGGSLGTYILDENHVPHPVSMLEWARWFGDADRHVAQTETELFHVSTVFLGLDHNWSNDGPPILFETMIFAKEGLEGVDGINFRDLDMDRYATYDEALAGHHAMVRQQLQRERAIMDRIKALKGAKA